MDITPLDAVAFGCFVLAWAAYNLVMDRATGRLRSINRRMPEVRRLWIARVLQRENRLLDSQLIGHSMNSVTFFASTSVLVIAGLLSVLAAGETAHRVVGELSIAARTSREFFELKLLLLVAIFTFGFLKFTWALRQYNFICALVGALPMGAVEPARRRALSTLLGSALSQALGAFNGGLRAYYFALAALGWFIQPWVFIAGTAGVTMLLLRRQLWSDFAATVGQLLPLLEDDNA